MSGNSKPMSPLPCHRRLLPLLCIAACTGASAATIAPTPSAAQKAAPDTLSWTPMLLAIDINRQQLDRTVLILRSRSGELYMDEETMKEARLLLPREASIPYQGARYFRLAALPTTRIELDEVKQSLTLELSPSAFEPTSSSFSSGKSPVPVRPTPGMFFNYDLFASHAEEGSVTTGALELGFFSALGHALSTVAVQDTGRGHRGVRLDTTLTIDRPDQVASLRFGDAISRPAANWGNAARFAGIQYSTNFAVRPSLITLPLQSFGAQAALPSTVDVFVNNVFTARREVPPGPFSLSDLPVITGNGNVSMVVRDIAGREQVVNQPFYANPTLLRVGLADFSVEAGALRRNYGVRSNDYGNRFASATYRRGLSSRMTGEAQVQWQASGQYTSGLNLVALVSSLGTVNASVAASASEAGNGRLWAVGFDRQASMFSFGARTQLADQRFRQLGDDPVLPRTRRLTTANVGISAGSGGSLGAFYLRQETPGQPRVELVNLNYSVGLGAYGALTLSGYKTLRGAPAQSLSMSWVMPLGEKINTSATHTVSRGGVSQTQLQAQRNLPAASGYGYRLQTGRNVPQQATLLLQNRVGNYALEAARFDGDTGLRASVSGGVAVLGGAAFASRRISDSFGVVQLPGMSDVDIYVDNQRTARTDQDGNALLPHLRAYDNNPVRVEQSQLRMDTTIQSLQMNAVPFARSGVVLRFPIRRSHGALMTLVSDDGAPLPPGALVNLEGQSEAFPVAMNGSVYITDLAAQNRLHAQGAGVDCRVTVAFTETDDPLPNLGKFVCKAGPP